MPEINQTSGNPAPTSNPAGNPAPDSNAGGNPASDNLASQVEQLANNPTESGAKDQAAPANDNKDKGGKAPDKDAKSDQDPKSDKDAKSAQADKGKNKADEPVRDASQVDLGSDADPAMADAFRSIAKEAGLTPKQMQALASWHTNLIANARQQMISDGLAELGKEWGAKAQQNQQQCIQVVSQIDRLLEKANPKLANAFSQAIESTGAACNVNFVRGLHAMAQLISEDSLQGAQGARAQAPEEVIDGIKAALSGR